MKARSWLPATIALALLAPGVARAEGLKRRFTIAFQGGMQSEIGGDLLKGGEGTLIGKPTTIESKRYRDVYGPDLRLQVLLAYGVGERVEVIAKGTYYKTDGTVLDVGTRADKTVFASFQPYEEAGFEVGVRYYISAARRLKSYVAPVVGARLVTEILVDFSVPDAGSHLLNVPFNQQSTVPVFGFDLGFSVDLGKRFFVGLDTGVRYQTAPEQFDELDTLTTIDDSDGRWTAPVVLSVGVRF
jgi:hypothetical protein